MFEKPTDDALLSFQDNTELVIDGAPKSLLSNGVSFMSGYLEPPGDLIRQILVDLELHPWTAGGKSTTDSRASSAAYAMAAWTSARSRDE